VIQFVEQRFGVFEKNLSPWRRAVAGDLTSAFNFANPNAAPPALPNTSQDLPPVNELAGGNVNSFVPTLGDVFIGVPAQEKGVRPARALPYQMNVEASVDASSSTVDLTFSNSGSATVVFQVRSGNPLDPVRWYTVEPGKTLSGRWNATASYSLSVYGPNGFVRYFNGSIGTSAAVLAVSSTYDSDPDSVAINIAITNLGGSRAQVKVLNAYTGDAFTPVLSPQGTFSEGFSLTEFFGWYDLIVTVAADPTFKYRLAGHVETGKDSFSDPALGGLVTLQG
jgi:phospholipase C